MLPTRPAVAVAAMALMGTLMLIVVGVLTSMRVGVLALAAFLIGGAVVRLMLRSSATITVRHRAVDALVLLVGGVALAYLGLTTALD